MEKYNYQVLGLMSGTSLDGLDLAICDFTITDNGWDYAINEVLAISYPSELYQLLKSATTLSGLTLAQLNVDLGIFIGNACRNFLSNTNANIDFIASHGHTVFHQPAHSLTLQIGSPAHISAISGHRVIADFRTTDVAYGGNGAPLVPIGDSLLFGEFDVCVNLGGIANLSFNQAASRLAFDCCPFNMVFNHFAEMHGIPYDDKGKLTESGNIVSELLDELNNLPFYQQTGPKSLGWEWVSQVFLPIFKKYPHSSVDLMHTFCAHVVLQLAKAIPDNAAKVLLTGGGAYHQFFVDSLRAKLPGIDIVVPNDKTLGFKEALIFAFLGVLRDREEANCLASVTGARKNVVGGAIYLP